MSWRVIWDELDGEWWCYELINGEINPAQRYYATEREAVEELIRLLKDQRRQIAEKILELGGTP